MPWWGWIVIGTLLFVAEMFAIDAQFFLVFIGIGAVIVGLVGLLGIDLPTWAQWILFAALSLTSMFTLRRQFYTKLRGRVGELPSSAKGSHIKVNEDVAPGHSSRAEYRGSVWTAINIGDEVIPSGATAVIDTVDGLNLKIKLLK